MCINSIKPQKALINSMIQRLEMAQGQIVHLEPLPWASFFFKQ